MNNIKLIIVSIFLTGTTYAHENSRNCILETFELVSEKTTDVSDCSTTKDLKLAEELISYPKISVGPIKVRFWEGEIVKHVTYEQVFKHEFVNICTGVLTYSKEKTYKGIYPLEFKIINPNLDPEIRESFRLAPLTNAEANQAWQNLKQECEQN